MMLLLTTRIDKPLHTAWCRSILTSSEGQVWLEGTIARFSVCQTILLLTHLTSPFFLKSDCALPNISRRLLWLNNNLLLLRYLVLLLLNLRFFLRVFDNALIRVLLELRLRNLMFFNFFIACMVGYEFSSSRRIICECRFFLERRFDRFLCKTRLVVYCCICLCCHFSKQKWCRVGWYSSWWRK